MLAAHGHFDDLAGAGEIYQVWPLRSFMETPCFRSHTLKQGAAVKRTTADGDPGVSRPGEPVPAERAFAGSVAR